MKKITKPTQAASSSTVDRLDRQLVALIEEATHLVLRLQVALATVRRSERR